MRNKAAVIEEVRNRGYEMVPPGMLNFNEQIQIFRSARIVVGVHGAGMTNIIFCEPGTIVYELVPAHYANSCFVNLGMICSLRYWQETFKSEGEAEVPINLRAWESDTQLIAERIDAELQAEAEQQPISAMDFLRGTPRAVPRS